jgi:diacylglycerol O-acyltransferase / wax synthase
VVSRTGICEAGRVVEMSMAGLTPMSVQDALWLTMDRPNNLMVVDGVMVLSHVPELQAVRAVFRAAVGRFPVLSRRAVRQGVGWAWQDDPAFDLDLHVRQARLTEPQDMAALQRFVAGQRALPLDNQRPMWQGFLVHPLWLEDGSEGAAIVTRFHHSIADGIRLTQVMLSLLGDDPDTGSAVVSRRKVKGGAAGSLSAPSEGPGDVGRTTVSGLAATVTAAAAELGLLARGVSSTAGAAAQEVVEGLGAAASAVSAAVADPRGSLARVPGVVAAIPGWTASAAMRLTRSGVHGFEGGFEVVRHPDRFLDALEVLGVEDNRAANDLSSVAKLAFTGSTRTVWTGKPGPVKAMAWSRPLPLQDIKALGRAQGATVNDVMLSAVAGGLRSYLALHGGEVDEVVWMVPVNLKPFEENLPADLGNYFALVFLPMPLGAADPATRLREMRHQMDRIKHSDEAVLTFGLQRLVSVSPGQVAFFLTNFFANKAVGVLTNVPGPRVPMTFAGAPVIQALGFAPCSGDNPMTATIFSYNGAVTVGFATDAGLVPDPDVLCGLVVDELMSMQATLGPSRTGKQRRRKGPDPNHE